MWSGTYCEIPSYAIDTILKTFINSLEDLPSSKIYSEKFNKDLLSVQSIISSRPQYYNSELSEKILKLIDIQMNLVEVSVIQPSLKLISLLDFALDLNR